jgi:hypothetical protein
MITIEVGKTYTTRGGAKVTIEYNTNEKHPDMPYSESPFYGRIINEKGELLRIAFYSPSGRYAPKESEFDIIKN